jgi:predicted nucleotidyltransferase
MDHGQPGSKGPTTYTDLNNVLRDFLVEVTKILGRNLCGAYLQGSFAVGDADVHSDVDFLVVTYDEVNATQELELRAMHERFPDRDVDWAKHLEGSYVPGQSLRRIDPAQPAWLYVDNGSKVMERSAHDNTAVVRWSMREHGIVLSGPDPRDLIDPVTATDLRSEIFARIDAFMPDLLTWSGGLDNAWTQPYVVGSLCRMLHTLEVGRVTSKREALQWAKETLDVEWSDLIQGALDDRPEPWLRVHRSARPGTVDTTWDFIEYAQAVAARQRDRFKGVLAS